MSNNKNTGGKNLSNSAENELWAAPQTKVVKKEKRKWGFFEVILSVFALVVVQVVMLLVMMAGTVQRMISDGSDLTDIDAQTEAVMKDVQQGGNLVLIMVSMYIIWVGFMFYSTHFRGEKSFAKDFWLKFSWKRDIIFGIILALALRGAEIGILSFLEGIGVDLTGSGNTANIVDQTGIWYFVIAILLASIIGPLCEELFFRGFLLQAFLRNFTRGNFTEPTTLVGKTALSNTPIVYNAYKALRHLTYKWRYALSVILTGVIFGLMHWPGTTDFAGWLPVIETGIIGIILGYIVVKTKRLGLAIVAHMAFNLSGVILASSSLFNQ